ncbi:MAG TPA: GIY-YIG nuclease family protein [Candidatus Udaeobacter sp.]|nr:GIY-YIG nuclease family protein [Candidatus Udaeobacter sp.]
MKCAVYCDQLTINEAKMLHGGLKTLHTDERSLATLGMTELRREAPHKSMKAFYVYMMTNRSRVVLYTGITNSLVRRAWQHQNGEVEGFTKTYKANRLVYYERFNDPRNAIAREKEIKGWRREKKNALVETMNPKWMDLSPTLSQHTRVIPKEVRDPT